MGARDEVEDAAVGVLQLDHVRDEAAALHGVEKIDRDRVAPGVEGRLFRQVVEGVVQLDRVEVAQVPREHPGRLHILGVIAADPVFVVVAGSADADVHGVGVLRGLGDMRGRANRYR